MPDTAPSNANNRVTLAVLETNQKHMIGLMEKQVKTSEKHDERIRANELAIVDHTVQLRIRTVALTGVSLIMSAGAALIGRL